MNKALLTTLKEKKNETSNCSRKKYIRNSHLRYFKLKLSAISPIKGNAHAINRIDNDETTSCLDGCFAFLMSDYCESVQLFLAFSLQGQK